MYQVSRAGEQFLHQNYSMEIMLCWKLLFTSSALHGRSLSRLRGNRDQYSELFLREPLVRELNFEKSPAGSAAFSVKIGLEVGAFSLICQMLAVFRGRRWLCDFYPCFRSLIFRLGLFPLYLTVFSFFFCSAYVVHLFDRCSKFLDPALDTSPLKISSHLQSSNFHYHDHCLSF